MNNINVRIDVLNENHFSAEKATRVFVSVSVRLSDDIMRFVQFSHLDFFMW